MKDEAVGYNFINWQQILNVTGTIKSQLQNNNLEKFEDTKVFIRRMTYNTKAKRKRTNNYPQSTCTKK